MLIVGFDGLTLPARVKALAARGALAGVVLFARNVAGAAQWARLIEEIGAAFPGLAPVVAIDQEGGTVQRLKPPALPEATAVPAMGRLHAVLDEAGFEALGRAMGAELRALGVNVDFAPVLDVDTNPANPVIGRRAFGVVPEDVIARGLAFARGLEAAGVAWCAKHFPGHGDTVLDSHVALPRLAHDRVRLDAVELAPFRAASLTRAPMMMTAHVVFEALDALLPATLSPRVVPGVLRAELGYDGVVISDDLDMKAIRDHFDADEVAAGLAASDVDLAMVCHDLDFAEALAARLRPSERSRARVERLRVGLVRPASHRMPRFPAALAEAFARLDVAQMRPDAVGSLR